MRLKTFGGLSVVRDGAAAAGGAATQRRRLALLAVLAAAGERGVSREKLLGYFWPDSDAERGRAALAQALYALRRDLKQDELFLGTAEIRLNPEVLPTDIGAFCAAIAGGRLEEAAALYDGPFLDGFYLNDAPEFERWVDTERSRLATSYAELLERLAEAATARGDPRAAAGWWRRLATADPLNARVAVGLMRALAAAGDRGGALQHARVYEALIRQELELEPDPAVTTLAKRLRLEPAPAVSAPAVALPAASPPAASPPAARASRPSTGVHLAAVAAAAAAAGAGAARAAGAAGPAAAASTGMPWRRRSFLDSNLILATIVGCSLLVVLVLLLLPPPEMLANTSELPVVAVGEFTDNSDLRAPRAAGPVSDMLATNLAQATGLQVVSSARMHELVGQFDGDTAVALVRAARQAGAHELIDGALYRLANGRLRLDLRRTDLVTGRVRRAASIEGDDLFQLVEEGTRELVATYGGAVSSLALSAVSTGSVVAYRLYEEGLHAYYQGDHRTAPRLFEAALAEDSTFAMAAYHLAMSEFGNRPRYVESMRRALRLSARASERERLLIRTQWAMEMDDPARLALAESLTVRYPAEPEGHLRLGTALVWDGRFLDAIVPLQRVIRMDSLSFARPTGPRCMACEAAGMMVLAYRLADSLDAAERVARRLAEVRPGSQQALSALADIYRARGRFEEALAAEAQAAPLDPYADRTLLRVQILVHAADFARADAELARLVAGPDSVLQQSARWWQMISLRMQGRLREAGEVARTFRRLGVQPMVPGAAGYDALSEAQILLELGRPRAAAALFDSVSRGWPLAEDSSRIARHRTWTGTLAATALAAAGDTADLEWRADSLAAIGQRSGFGRDRRLYHHVRGLLFAARGQLPVAERELRAAIFSPTIGYTRTNYDLAQVLLRQGRPRDAVPVLQAALRGQLDGSNLYVTFSDLHELLARNWDAAGRADSAAAHYRWLVRAWRGADPALAPRRTAALARLEALGGAP